MLIALILNFINNNNMLFATRLGATDFQLTLVNGFPQLVGILVLLPGGILTDRMQNKRKMVIYSLLSLIAVYFAIGFSPMFGSYSLTAFMILLSLSIGPMTIYNASWQAYFSDTIEIEQRNSIFTLRTKYTFLINIAAPLLTGYLLSKAASNSSKILIHQSLFWVSCIFALLQVLVLRKISGGNAKVHGNIGIKDLKTAAVDLAKNKKFIGFFAVALFFYMTWHLDWTLFYIGQTKYLKLDEAWLSYVNVGIAVGQFLTIGFWSRVNEKLGIRFSIIIGSAVLFIFPIIMIVSTSLPLSIAPTVFLILCTINSLGFATVTLNVMQCLLQVIPEKNKTLSISIYTVFITASTGIMPIVGVRIYDVLGSTLRAFQITFVIIAVLRVFTTALWTLRWWLLRKEPK